MLTSISNASSTYNINSFVRWGKIYVKRKDLGKALEYYEMAQMEFQTKETERLIKTTILEKKKADAKAYINPELAEEAKQKVKRG